MVQARWEHLNRDYSLLTASRRSFSTATSRRARGPCPAADSSTSTAPPASGGAGDRRRGGWTARHPDRGPRPLLPGAAGRLEVPVPPDVTVPGRAAGRRQRLQAAAVPLGQGLDPDRTQAPAQRPARRSRWQAKLEAFVHLTNNARLPADDPAVAAGLPGHGRATQHDLDALIRSTRLFAAATLPILLFYVVSQLAVRPHRADQRFTCCRSWRSASACRSTTRRAVVSGLSSDGGLRAHAEVPHRVAARSVAPQALSRRSDATLLRGAAADLLGGRARTSPGSLEMWASLPFLLLFFHGYAYVFVLSIWRRLALATLPRQRPRAPGPRTAGAPRTLLAGAGNTPVVRPSSDSAAD